MVTYQTTCWVVPITQVLVESGLRTAGTKTSRASRVAEVTEIELVARAKRKVRADVLNCMVGDERARREVEMMA